jgi:hypothetical protein
MIEKVQNNYQFYSKIYNFYGFTYRNDYALTIALNTVNGHLQQYEDYIPWKLLHVTDKTIRIDDITYRVNTKPDEKNISKYILISGIDFHMMNKNNYIELV